MNACSNARFWLSVSTVPPDLLDHHDDGAFEALGDCRADHVRLRRVEHRQLHAGGAQITSGASEDPPMPHSTT